MGELNNNTQNFTSNQENDEMQFSITDILAIFVHRKWWMVAGVAICLAFGQRLNRYHFEESV